MLTFSHPFDPDVLGPCTDAIQAAAETLMASIDPMVLGASLGATGVVAVPGRHGRGGIVLTAMLRPLHRDGRRARHPVTMSVLVSVVDDGVVDVEVVVKPLPSRIGGIEHVREDNVPVGSVTVLLRALDHDGDGVALDPDVWPVR